MNDKNIQNLFNNYKERYDAKKILDDSTSNLSNTRDMWSDFLAIKHIISLLAEGKNDPENIYTKLYNNFNDNIMKGMEASLKDVDNTSQNARSLTELKHKIEDLQAYIVDKPNASMPNILNERPDALKAMLSDAIKNVTTSFNNILNQIDSKGTKPR